MPISIDATQLSLLLALAAARLLPIVMLTPLFGGQYAPARFRLGLLVLLAIAFVPWLWGSLGGRAVPTQPGLVVALLAKELFAGLVLTVLLQAMFAAYAAVGGIVDVSRGAANMEIFSPLNRQPESPLGMGLSLAAVVVFLGLGGHRLLLEGLADSYAILPVVSLEAPAGLGLDTRGLDVLLGLLGAMLRVAVLMASPVIVTLFLIDTAFGLMNRAAPSINVSLLSLGLRSWAGLGILALSLGVTFAMPIQDLGGLVLGLLRGVGGGP